MDLNLSPTQKRQALESAQSTMTYEAFSLMIRLGVDPDDFQESDFEALEATAMAGELTRLRSLLASLEIVKSKLAAL